MISNTPAGVKKQAEGGSYPLYQLVNLNGDDHDDDLDDDDHDDGDDDDSDDDDDDDQCFSTNSPLVIRDDNSHIEWQQRWWW